MSQVVKFLSSQTSARSEEHTSELQSRVDLVCSLLLEKKNSSSSASAPGPNSKATEPFARACHRVPWRLAAHRTRCHRLCRSFFFFGPASTVIYTLSLHDALPI